MESFFQNNVERDSLRIGFSDSLKELLEDDWTYERKIEESELRIWRTHKWSQTRNKETWERNVEVDKQVQKAVERILGE